MTTGTNLFHGHSIASSIIINRKKNTIRRNMTLYGHMCRNIFCFYMEPQMCPLGKKQLSFLIMNQQRWQDSATSKRTKQIMSYLLAFFKTSSRMNLLLKSSNECIQETKFQSWKPSLHINVTAVEELWMKKKGNGRNYEVWKPHSHNEHTNPDVEVSCLCLVVFPARRSCCLSVGCRAMKTERRKINK